MKNKKDTNFYYSPENQPHPQRTKDILAAHPEVVKLMGRNPKTFLVLVGLVLTQTCIAAYMGTLGFGYWWLALIVAYCVGAFMNHPLYAIIHEATHNLIFKNKTANKWCALLSDLPNTVPGAMGFSTYHLKHHSYMGDDHLDADLPTPIEARIVGNNTILKAIWLLFFPIWQIFRTFGLHKIQTWHKWMYINLLVVFTFDALMVYFFGWTSLFYLFSSMVFALGLHPLGARWIQEHYTLDPNQETYSYYGPINKIGLNIGYHQEHHDFPSIPWNNLPSLRKMAPEFYDTLIYHTSWSKLLFAFLFNPEYSLYSRVKREKHFKMEEKEKEEKAVLVG